MLTAYSAGGHIYFYACVHCLYKYENKELACIPAHMLASICSTSACGSGNSHMGESLKQWPLRTPPQYIPSSPPQWLSLID